MAMPAPDRVRVSGPLAAFADGFLVDLVEQQGYRLWPAQRHLEFLASVSRWNASVRHRRSLRASASSRPAFAVAR